MTSISLARNRLLEILLPLGFFLSAIVMKVPFQSQMLYHWDSVNFALGLEHFDLRLHQPHPPGYFLYIMLGKLVNLFFHDANTSLVWLSILFSGLTAVSLFYLARAMFDQREAIITGILFLTSPMFWFHGEIALARILEAFFVTFFALICYKLLIGNGKYLFISGFVLAMAGGVRLNTLILLFPLWWFSIRRFSRRSVGVTLILFALVTLGWLIPMLSLTGGLEGYLQICRAEQQGLASNTISGIAAAPINLIRLSIFVFYTLLAGSLILVYWLWVKLRSITLESIKEVMKDERAQLMILWIGPSFLLCTYVLTQPGQTFTFMPSLLILLAVATIQVSSDILTRVKHHFVNLNSRFNSNLITCIDKNTISSAMVVILTVISLLFFLLAPPYLLGIERNVLNTPSWHSIKARDAYLRERIQYISEHFPPEVTVIMAARLDHRTPEYYLREYRSIQLPSKNDLRRIVLPPGITLILFTETLNQINRLPERTQTIVLPSGNPLSYVVSRGDETFVVSATDITVRNILACPRLQALY